MNEVTARLEMQRFAREVEALCRRYRLEAAVVIASLQLDNLHVAHTMTVGEFETCGKLLTVAGQKFAAEAARRGVSGSSDKTPDPPCDVIVKGKGANGVIRAGEVR